MSNKFKETANLTEPSVDTFKVGLNCFIEARRVVAILEHGSLPLKRFVERATNTNMLIDATRGKKTRSLILLDSNHVFLSALAAQTLRDRLHPTRMISPAQVELEEGEFVS